MKVCWFADARSPHVHTLACALSRLGVSIHVVTHKPALVPGATVERFSIPQPGITNLRRWHGRHVRYLEGFLKRFDVVNVHFLEDWGFTAEMLYSGCFVASAWGSDIVPPPDEHLPTPEVVAARQAMLRHATTITACGPTFARMVAEFAGLPCHRVEVVPFGVDLSRFQPQPQTIFSAGASLVGFLKGFRAVYGPDTLIRAIPHVIQHCPDTLFEFVGDGPMLDQCRTLACKLGIEGSIRWLGRVAHADVPGILARWEISVIPSRSEAFGVAALESSAMGIPVIASDVGGLRDTVRAGETGLLVPVDDDRAVAEAIIGLLKDEACRHRLGSAGRMIVAQEYELHRIARQWADMYQRAMSRTSCMV